MKKALIIGGGIGGCVAAIELKKKGWHTTLVDAASELGAGLRTRFIGGHPFTYGPRHFLTHNKTIYDYLNALVPLRLCAEHQFLSYIEQDMSFYNYPIHYDDIDRMPESTKIKAELGSLESLYRDNEYKLTQGDESNLIKAANYKDFWLKSVGPILYDKFISSYTKKMWRVDDESIIDDFTWSPKGVAIKKGPRNGWDTAISAYPIASDGYNKIFDIAKEVISSCFLNTELKEIDPISRVATINGEYKKYDVVINTVPLDSVFSFCHGKLIFIGRDIQYIVLPIENVLPKDVYFTYYCGSEKYTRVTEYKKFTRHQSDQTLISIETPSNNGRYYPLPIASQRALAKKYTDMLDENFFTIGRLGLYNYRYDIDDVVEQALACTANL
jgi:UDP-galactopyranose mutase